MYLISCFNHWNAWNSFPFIIFLLVLLCIIIGRTLIDTTNRENILMKENLELKKKLGRL